MSKHELQGFTAYKSYVQSYTGDKNKLIVLFTADKNPNAVCPIRRSGQAISWCDDCNQAFDTLAELVSAYLKQEPSGHFLTVYVGTRDAWKDANNGFRTELGINSIPTLLNYGTGHSINESACLDKQQIDQVLHGK